MNAGIPIIEITDDADAFGVFRPNSKTYTVFAVNGGEVGAKHFVGVKVGAVMEKVQIVVVERSGFHKVTSFGISGLADSNY